MVSAFCLAAGPAASLADSHKPATGPFAEFLACMKEHGAPALAHHRLSAADRAALKQAFAACRDLLPKRTDKGHGDRAGHKFTPPTAAQVTAFKSCMADKGFSLERSSTGKRPDLRDPAVRSALKAALKACLPMLKPAAPSSS